MGRLRTKTVENFGSLVGEFGKNVATNVAKNVRESMKQVAKKSPLTIQGTNPLHKKGGTRRRRRRNKKGSRKTRSRK